MISLVQCTEKCLLTQVIIVRASAPMADALIQAHFGGPTRKTRRMGASRPRSALPGRASRGPGGLRSGVETITDPNDSEVLITRVWEEYMRQSDRVRVTKTVKQTWRRDGRAFKEQRLLGNGGTYTWEFTQEGNPPRDITIEYWVDTNGDLHRPGGGPVFVKRREHNRRGEIFYERYAKD